MLEDKWPQNAARDPLNAEQYTFVRVCIGATKRGSSPAASQFRKGCKGRNHMKSLCAPGTSLLPL